MSEQYQWDKSGEPSEEIVRLEETMQVLRHEEPFRFPQTNTRARPWAMISAAAVLFIVVGVGLWKWKSGTEDLVVRKQNPVGCAQASDATMPWSVELLRGQARCNSAPVSRDPDSAASMAVGSVLETEGDSEARIQIADIGTVDLSPNSRLSLQKTSTDEHRLKLHQGRIHATIDAPPRLFLVETPSALAVDLGCEYFLEVIGTGETRLSVLSGYVSLETETSSVYVPAGYTSYASEGRTLGIPVPNTANEALRNAAAQLSKTPTSSKALATFMDASKTPEDSLGIWHLWEWPGVECERINAKLRALTKKNPDPLGLGWGACSDKIWQDSWRNVLSPVWDLDPLDAKDSESGPAGK